MTTMPQKEVVTVTQYRSLDGNLYADEDTANRADAVWRDQNEWEMDKEIKFLTRYSRFFDTEDQRKEKGWPTLYPVLISEIEKHGTSYYIAMDRVGLLDAFWKIFEGRMDDDYGIYKYLDDKWIKISKHILETGNKEAAYGMIRSRSSVGCEYEIVELETSVQVFGENYNKQP